MRASVSPYEVRCPRCDVSFPVETKTCMHCGGATAKPGRFEPDFDFASTTGDPGSGGSPFESSNAGSSQGSGSVSSRGPSDPDVESMLRLPDFMRPDEDPSSDQDPRAEAAFESEASASAASRTHPAHPAQADDFDEAEEPGSVGRSLVRGLGGFIWIIVLIGFSLARNCGGE